MSDRHSLTTKLDGIEGTRVLLEDFAATCESLRICLNHVARCLNADHVSYEIHRLNAASAEVCVAPVCNDVPDAALDDLTDTFRGSVSALENGGPLDEPLDYSAIRSFEQLARPVKLRRASLRIADTTITHSYIDYAAHLLSPDAACLGSVSGVLERVSIHGRATFTLYPPIESEQVECSFSPNDLPRVLNALGQKVTVYGILTYAKRRAFPVSASVDSFDIEPPDELLPTLFDARHEIAGGLSSTDVVWESRNAW